MERDSKLFRTKSGLWFVQDAPGKMTQISCSYGAFLSLGADSMEKVLNARSNEWRNDNPKLIFRDLRKIKRHRMLAEQVCEILYFFACFLLFSFLHMILKLFENIFT